MAAHMGHGGPDDAHGTQEPMGGVAGCRAPAGDGPDGTGVAAGRQQQGPWRVSPHVRPWYPSQVAEAGQPPVHAGQAVGGSGGPQQGHGAHRPSDIPGTAARCGAECPAGAPHTLGRGGHPAPRVVARGAHAACPAEYGRGGRGDVHADDRVPAACAGRDAAAADACPPAVGGEPQAVAAGGERASHPYGGRGGHGEAGGVGRGGVLGPYSGGNGGSGMGRRHRVPAQQAAVQGPGLLQGVQGVPQGAGPGTKGSQVHGRGHPAGAGGLHGGDATAEGPGAGRLACGPEQHVAR